MLIANSLARVFLMEDKGQQIRLADPDSTWGPEAVLNFYTNTYPILTTAKIEAPEIQDDELQIRFVSTMGIKG